MSNPLYRKLAKTCYHPAAWRLAQFPTSILLESGTQLSWRPMVFEAVVLGVAALREHDCDPGDVAQIEVEVRKSIKHSLTLRRVREWLHRASKNPKEALMKERLRDLV